ncbi:MAG: TM1802 family CRISPR-associated protein, partial [bacterium]|nr:TM1802 family CRISPR-associated protein [bacterium]
AKYKTKEIIQKYNTLKKYNPNYNISKLRRFFISKEKLLTIDSEKFFLEFIEKIFKIQPVNQSLLIKYTLITLKNIINNLYKFEGEIFNFETCVLDSLSNLLFFTNLGIVEICYFCGGGKMFENIYKDLNLDTYNKQGLFMLGCICRILLDKQRERLNNMPFLNKLKSLKMNKKDFQELLPFVINKFYEYDSYGKIQDILSKEISEKLLRSDWNLSNEEMNFYFACGMALYRNVKQIVYGGDYSEQ